MSNDIDGYLSGHGTLITRFYTTPSDNDNNILLAQSHTLQSISKTYHVIKIIMI